MCYSENMNRGNNGESGSSDPEANKTRGEDAAKNKVEKDTRETDNGGDSNDGNDNLIDLLIPPNPLENIPEETAKAIGWGTFGGVVGFVLGWMIFKKQ